MKKVIVRAPVRADLAGGTLDLWPLYLFHPGSRTVNVAISFYAESEVAESGDGAIEIHQADNQYRQRYESLQELSADPKAALFHKVLEHFHLTGLRITTRTDAPRGSGLGGSSALTVTLVRALSELAGNPIEGDALINLVRDLETRLLGVPAGIQDYYPPVYGGLASLHLVPGAPRRMPLRVSVDDLGQHMVMHYTGVAHFSGTNNWEMYKRQIDGKKKVQKGFSKIAATSIEMEKALEAANWEAAGRALASEWENRKALIEGISTPEIDSAIAGAIEAGAWGGKVCGAGGGGCIVFLFPPERRGAVVEALAKVPGRTLDCVPVAHGMTVETVDDAHATPPARGRLLTRRVNSTVEQLYVYGGSGDYRPYLLAEAVVTHADGRSGLHSSSVRSYVAPIEARDGAVMWHHASRIDPETLDIRAVPDPAHRMDTAIAPEVLAQTAARSDEAFRQFLSEKERLQIFHNPTFGLWSEHNETRAAFVQRCIEEANRRIEDQAERLESTFRRRIDQLKQRSEREEREMDQQEENTGIRDESRQDLNVAWGQALYNITSGRGTAVSSDTPTSVREFDYLENIAQIQRAWDRELQNLRDELHAKAREVEDVAVVPTAKNIEVTKYLILWAAGLG
jgi:D-glycero-alpha-D-manno-heptose-7-phosphate kinase